MLNDEQKDYIKKYCFEKKDTNLNKQLNAINSPKSEIQLLEYLGSIGVDVDVFQAPGENPHHDNTVRILDTVNRIKEGLKDNPNFELEQKYHANPNAKWQQKEDLRKDERQKQGQRQAPFPQ